MITGDNPLTAVHVARDVEIVDRDALILDLKENAAHEAGMLTGVSDTIRLFSLVHFSCRSLLAYRGREQDHSGRPFQAP